MAVYVIRPSGSEAGFAGFTIVALEHNGEERPLIVFPTEEQARGDHCFTPTKGSDANPYR